MTIEEQLIEFWSDHGNRNAHITNDITQLYVRISTRQFDGKMEASNCFDIATIDVDEDHQRKGIFTSILNFIIRNCPCKYLYVECVVNLVIIPLLTRNGFIQCDNDYSCYYLKLRE